MKTITVNRSGGLDLSGCDLEGVTLQTHVDGSLDVRGCDLNGVTWPTDDGTYSAGCALHLTKPEALARWSRTTYARAVMFIKAILGKTPSK